MNHSRTLHLIVLVPIVLGAAGLGVFVAAQPGLPHTFAPGEVISAGEVNDNFAALAGAIDALDAAKQNGVTGSCPAGSSIRAIDADGGVLCHEDQLGEGGGGGDITAVEAGSGLSGGGVSGALTLSLDTDVTDARYYPRAAVDAKIADNPGPAGADGSDGSSVSASLAGGSLTVCNDAGTPQESCTTESVRGPQGEAGADGVSGWEIVTKDFTVANPSTVTVGLACPTGKKALGGGGSSSDINNVVIVRTRPSPNGTGWTTDWRDLGDATDVTFTAHAICAKVE